MKEDLWLKQIKEKLDDYAEPLPASGWERLEKDLQALPMSSTPKVIPLYRRWSIVAAAAVLLTVSTVSIWLMQSPLSHDIQQAAVAVTSSHNEPSSSVIEKCADEVLAARKMPGEVLLQEQVREKSANSFPVQQIEATSDSLATQGADELKQLDTKDSHEQNTSSEETAVTNAQRKVRYRPSSKDKYHLPVARESLSSGRGWSFALAVANTGSFHSVSNTAGTRLSQGSGSVLTSDGIFDLSATAQDIFYIPDGQDLVFYEGIPVLRGNNLKVVSIDHHQPVSVAVSVWKKLSHGISLESSIQYTYLASDVTLLGSGDLKQKLHYLGIPLRVNWSFWHKERFELYVSAGGVVEKCVYGKLGSRSSRIKPLQLSVLGAVGAQLNLNRTVGLYVEPGVSYFFDDGSAVETIRKENPCNFTLQGGIRFTY